jgi:hypothetical protein
MTTAGFGPFDLNQITINGAALDPDYKRAVTNILIQRSNMGSSLLTMQLTDPERQIIQKVAKQGATLKIDGLSYTLSQFVKASDQVQLIFESSGVYALRGQRKPTKAQTGNQYVTPFMKSLVWAIRGMTYVGPDYAATYPQLIALKANKGITLKTVPPFAVGRGSGATTDTNEDSWTCLSRIASTIGWRLWESGNVVYCGPDEYWLGKLPGQKGIPPVNKAVSNSKIPDLKEFTRTTQLIDFDWNVNKPLGQASVTCMLDGFSYNIGQIVNLQGVGIANGHWMVSSIQRNMFMPTAAMVLNVPMPLATYVNPTSLPLSAFPLK